MHTLAADTGTYLANKPTGVVIWFLIFALIAALGAVFVAIKFAAWYAIGLALCAAFLVGAFMVKG